MHLLFALYSLASLAHFSHNAVYIAFYPGLPAFITPQTVWLAWLAVAAVGGAALLARRFGLRRVAAVLVFAYGLLGLDGLQHYTLALCSQHTLGSNLTIGAEVLLGLALACAAAVRLHRLRELRQAGGARGGRPPAAV